MVRKWIQMAIHRPGSLHKDLEILRDKKIPAILLNAIIKAHAGDTIKNPTSVGKKKILVTRKIEQRAILVRNLNSMRKKKIAKLFFIHSPKRGQMKEKIIQSF